MKNSRPERVLRAQVFRLLFWCIFGKPRIEHGLNTEETRRKRILLRPHRAVATPEHSRSIPRLPGQFLFGGGLHSSKRGNLRYIVASGRRRSRWGPQSLRRSSRRYMVRRPVSPQNSPSVLSPLNFGISRFGASHGWSGKNRG